MKITIMILVLSFGFFQAGNSLKAQADNSEMTLMKTFKGELMETTKKIYISPHYKSLNIELFSSVKAGLISITLIKPDGEKFKTIEVDSSSDVRMEDKFDLQNAEWTGDWHVKIKSDNAEGTYSIRIRTKN